MDWLKELPGAIATICIVLSFCFNNLKTIRWLNLIGSIFFVIYTLFVPSLFTGVANGIIIFVNSYYLIKMSKEEKLRKENDSQELRNQNRRNKNENN